MILLRQLVISDFKIRYQGSVLGYLWALLRPLFLFAILYVVFVYFLRIGADIPHWPVAMLLGIVMWHFFAEVTNQGLKSVENNGGVIRKINFPKYVTVFSVGISAFINLAINLVVVGVFMIISGVPIGWSILLAPIFILQLFVLAVGLAFILSTIYVKYRDINFFWEVVMQGLFYGSAILFPITRVAAESDLMAKLLLLNPVAQSVQDARYFAISSDLPTLSSVAGGAYMIIPLGITVAALIVGALYFRRRSRYFAEEA
jgi:ABC-2 type transport system permease protein